MGQSSKRDRSSGSSKKKLNRDRSGASSSKTEKQQFDHVGLPGVSNNSASSGGGNHLSHVGHERSLNTSKVVSLKTEKYAHEKGGKRSKSLPSRKDRDKSSSRNSSSLNHTSGHDVTSTLLNVPSVSTFTPAPRRNLAPPPLDPIRLARGMSARSIGARISHHLHILNADEIDKDLRHMEAHRSASLAYAQQFFAFKNHELVRSGHYGRYGGVPGESQSGEMAGYGERENDKVGEDEGLTSMGRLGGDGARRSDLIPIPPTSSSFISGRHTTSPLFALPVKIDPEEEKRLLQLRIKIAAFESQREQLETEYLSLRAHCVHESQLVRKTQAYETGRLKLLLDLMERKGRVLALNRVKMAVSRDVLCCLKYRGEAIQKGVRPPIMSSGHGVGLPGSGNNKKAGQSFSGGASADLVELWNNIEFQHKEAELACMNLETPLELKQIMGSDEASQKSSKRPRSPSRKGSSDDAESVGSASKKSLRNGSSNGSGGGGGCSADEPSNNKKYGIPSGLEAHVIPWESMVQPRTPFNLPILLSCLSKAPDKAVGFLTKKNNPTAVTWIEANLPESEAEFNDDATELIKFREESRLLSEELHRESEFNSGLQSKIITSRKRSDEMVAMMQLLRSETEAVLERHNIILESPEARENAAELYRLTTEEGKLEAAGEEEDEEEDEDEDQDEDDGVRHEEDQEDGELDEHDHLHDDDENEDDFSQDDDESAEEGEIQEEEEEDNDGDDEGDDEDEEDPVQIKEVIVKPDENDVVTGDTDDEDDDDDDDNHVDDEEEGEIIEEDDAEEGEIEEDDAPDVLEEMGAKRAHGDREDLDLSPPDSSGFNKKRRRI